MGGPLDSRVILDVCGVQTSAQGERGIPRYIADHVGAVRAAGASIGLVGLAPEHPLPARAPASLLSDPDLAWLTAREVRERTSRAAGVVFHAMSPFEIGTPRRPLVPGHIPSHAGVASTVYDVIPWIFKDHYLRDPWNRRGYMARLESLLASDLLLTISHATARDLVEHCGADPDRCRVIGTGVSDFFRPSSEGDDPGESVRRTLPDIDRPHVLCVAGYEWRKNVPRLIQAWATLPADLRRAHQLVIACHLPDQGRREWSQVIADAGLTAEDVVLTGLVTDATLRDLYRSTELFVFPSFYEGFGLPVAEAVRCGAPVITAATSSLPEIIDLPESTFDPYDVEAIGDAIHRGLTDAAFRSRLLEAGRASVPRHDWRRVAAATLEAYDELAAQAVARRRTLVRERRRLALVGPFAPSPSGVAEYNTRLVEALVPHVDLTCFVETPPGGRRSDLPVDQLPASALGSVVHPSDFDAVVHTIGNSVFHHQTADLAHRFGGVVWMHDVNLSGLYLSEARTHPHPEEVMQARLREAYGDRIPHRLRGREILDPPAYSEGAVRLSSLLARRARRVIVSSHLAERLLDIDLGPLDHAVSVSVLPLAVPRRTPVPEPEEGPVTVTSFGIVDRGKGIDELMEAVAQLRRDHDVRLRLVGELPESLGPHVESRARELGIVEACVVTGWVETEAYEQELAGANVVVQLRSSTNGESSAAVLDAISVGRAVVTSVASASELPAGTVTHLGLGAPVADVVAALEPLVTAPAARAEMVAAQREYAPTWGFEDVALRLLEIALP